MIGFVTPATISPSHLQQRLQYASESSVVPDLILALEKIPINNNGTVEFETLSAMIVQFCSSRAVGEYGCPYCDRLYNTAALAATHLQSHTGPFFACSVPNCRANVGQIRMMHRQMYYHMTEHKKQDEKSDLASHPPSRLDAQEHWKRTPQEIREYITQLLEQKPDSDYVKDGCARNYGAKTSDEETKERYFVLKQQAAILAQDGEVRATKISQITQAQVLSYNMAQVEKGEL